MREIIFRGKRIDNGGWAEGFCAKTIQGNSVIFNTIDECPCGFCMEMFDSIKNYVVIPETVGQYTGLTDKNGKKIFENDIIDASKSWWNAYGPAGHSSPIISVEWNDYHCGFDPFADYDCDCGVYIDPDKVEVIGNIHDNPELIKEAKKDGN